MADINIKKDYFNVEMLHFIIIIGVINGISPCVGTIESHGQGSNRHCSKYLRESDTCQVLS